MNAREIENALLLRDSGELSGPELEKLSQALRSDPLLAALAQENRVLQAAGPLSSSLVVPPLSDLTRERILQAAHKPPHAYLPRLLALAAMLVLGLALLPHLTSRLQPTPSVLTTAVDPIRPNLTAEDPILNELQDLENELALWSALPVSDPGFIENENDWAEILISAEESI
jgi:hypothetical protein